MPKSKISHIKFDREPPPQFTLPPILYFVPNKYVKPYDTSTYAKLDALLGVFHLAFIAVCCAVDTGLFASLVL